MMGWSRGLAFGVALVVVIATFGAVGGPFLFTEHRPGSSLRGVELTHSVSPFNAPLSVSLSVNPSPVQKGNQISVSTTVSGGTSPYSFTYSGLPPGCGGNNVQSFSCNPSSTGSFQIQASVTDNNGNTSVSNSVSLTVTSSSGGNGNGNGGGNNSSNPFSGLLSGLGGFLSLLLIFGIVGFVTWILLIVGVWIIAIVLVRRLPKRGATTAAPATAATKKKISRELRPVINALIPLAIPCSAVRSKLQLYLQFRSFTGQCAE